MYSSNMIYVLYNSKLTLFPSLLVIVLLCDDDEKKKKVGGRRLRSHGRGVQGQIRPLLAASVLLLADGSGAQRDGLESHVREVRERERERSGFRLLVHYIFI